ncbi:MAG TPA: DUF4956 domain-containing protein [Blastocatellia bacterium]|nr:DUF4956 domain-containing protein [Blastocatellia bacterium]
MSNYHEQDEIHQDTLRPDSVAPTENQEKRGSDVGFNGRRAIHRAWPAFGRGWKRRLPKMKKIPVLGLALLLGGVAVVVLGMYLIFGRANTPAVQDTGKQSSPRVTAPPPAALPSTARQSEPGLSGLFGGQASNEQEPMAWLPMAASITLKLALAGLLAALLAFRPHKEIAILQRNPYVAQTQILLAIVAAALMMIVADNAARAFGIFAAASLVRFRTNIRDPKEITVLLMSLAIGLASGVGKVEVAIILSLFSLLVLSVLEYYEPQEIFRAMELTVTSRKVEETDQVLREIFEKRNMTTELRKVDREDPDNPTGKIVYYVNVNGHLSTDQLSEEIFASDPDNVDSINWDQKKTSSYIYR